MDRMLKDEAYRSELDALRRRGDGAPEAGAGGPRGGGEPADADEEDGPVSTTEALNMLRQARARRRARRGAGEGAAWGRGRGGARAAVACLHASGKRLMLALESCCCAAAAAVLVATTFAWQICRIYDIAGCGVAARRTSERSPLAGARRQRARRC